MHAKVASAANTDKPDASRGRGGVVSGGLHRCDTVIAIGASTGGPDAICRILKDFPPGMPPILVVQHMPPAFTGMYAHRLDEICAMDVREARDGETIRSGLALIAPGGLHMRVEKMGSQRTVRCFRAEKVNGHCPSVDVLFVSVADVCGGNSIGIILTGMGTDGARGLSAMKNAGAVTIGQDMASSVVYGMPKAAYDLGGVGTQAPLSRISRLILDQIGS